MFSSTWKKTLIILFIVIVNVSCDQVTKEIVRKEISTEEIIPVIKGFFTLTKIENTGAFLSLGDSLPESVRFLLLSLLPVLVLLGGIVILLLKKGLSPLIIIGFSFVIGGGIGNLYDRFAYGSVTDFMHMDFKIFQTGIFNIADVSIMIGMGIVLLDSFLTKQKKVII